MFSIIIILKKNVRERKRGKRILIVSGIEIREESLILFVYYFEAKEGKDTCVSIQLIEKDYNYVKSLRY